jgi:3-dehydroquinate synthetase
MGYNKKGIVIEESTRESRYYNIDDNLRDMSQEHMFISLPDDEKTKNLIETFNNIYAKITVHMTEVKNS